MLNAACDIIHSLIESVEVSQIFIKYTSKKWVGFDKYGYITISKFMRIKKHSSDYNLFSKQIFIPDAEVQKKKSITYNKNADIEHYLSTGYRMIGYSHVPETTKAEVGNLIFEIPIELNFRF